MKQMILASLLAGIAHNAAAEAFSDADWNTSFVSSCGLPAPMNKTSAVAWKNIQSNRKLMFTLQKGQVGQCSTDSVARHRAKYWERAELTQSGRLRAGSVNVIEFEATFLRGFQGERETFFQIHNWSPSCHAYPPVMMKMDKGRLQIALLRDVEMTSAGEISDKGRHRTAFRDNANINQHYGTPIKFRIELDLTDPTQGQLRVLRNDKVLFDQSRVDVASCALPFVKLGIYRPGGVSDTSSIAFDDVNITYFAKPKTVRSDQESREDTTRKSRRDK